MIDDIAIAPAPVDKSAGVAAMARLADRLTAVMPPPRRKPHIGSASLAGRRGRLEPQRGNGGPSQAARTSALVHRHGGR